MKLETFIEVEKALRGLSEKSRQLNFSSLKSYVKFTALDPKQLIEEAKTDKIKPNSSGVPEERLYAFYKHLLTNNGLSKKLAGSYFNAVRIFYKKNGFPLRVTLTRALKYAEYVLGIH